MQTLISQTQQLASHCDTLKFNAPVTHVYNPLNYAWQAHYCYLTRYAQTPKKVIYFGINPGPWGMAQTGIPFGEVAQVRDWMGITAPISQPLIVHPKRPIDGFACKKSEVSGRRLWNFFASRYGSADTFFRDNFVVNYCPLLFIDGQNNKAKNLTPDKINSQQTTLLYRYCDNYLKFIVEYFKSSWVIGIGAFAEKKLQTYFAHHPTIKIGRIIHPSPANPQSNRGFFEIAKQQLDDIGI